MNKTTKCFSYSFLFVASLLVFSSAQASSFPNDSITELRSVAGNGNTIIDSSTSDKTILGVQIMQSNTASDTVVRCGSTAVLHNYALSSPMVFMNYKCSNTINIEKTGNDNAHIVVTYVDYDMQLIPTLEQSQIETSLKLSELSENQKLTTGYIFMIIVFSAIYIISRFIFNLIKTMALGW